MKRTSVLSLLLLVVALLSASYTHAQQSVTDPTLDKTLQQVYGIISGPANQPRDWETFKTLFVSNARMGVTTVSKEATTGFKSFTPEEYIATSGKYVEEHGFFEKEVSRKTEQFGNIVHIFSTYEARNNQTDSKPFMRGINSIQLVKIGADYKVVSLIWQPETPTIQLPAHYLPAKK